MYGLDEDKEPEDTGVQDLLTYLGHCNKPEHVATVVNLIKQSQAGQVRDLQKTVAAAIEGSDERMRGRRRDFEAPDRLRSIEVPSNTRKVTLEF